MFAAVKFRKIKKKWKKNEETNKKEKETFLESQFYVNLQLSSSFITSRKKFPQKLIHSFCQ